MTAELPAELRDQIVAYRNAVELVGSAENVYDARAALRNKGVDATMRAQEAQEKLDDLRGRPSLWDRIRGHAADQADVEAAEHELTEATRTYAQVMAQFDTVHEEFQLIEELPERLATWWRANDATVAAELDRLDETERIYQRRLDEIAVWVRPLRAAAHRLRSPDLPQPGHNRFNEAMNNPAMYVQRMRGLHSHLNLSREAILEATEHEGLPRPTFADIPEPPSDYRSMRYNSGFVLRASRWRNYVLDEVIPHHLELHDWLAALLEPGLLEIESDLAALEAGRWALLTDGVE